MDRRLGSLVARKLGADKGLPDSGDERAFKQSAKRTGLGCAGIMLMGMFLFSVWDDFKFAMNGVETQGHVLDTATYSDRGVAVGVMARVRIILSGFSEIVMNRGFPLRWQMPADRKVKVTYLPDSPREWRLDGEVIDRASTAWLGITALIVIAIGWGRVLRTLASGWILGKRKRDGSPRGAPTI